MKRKTIVISIVMLIVGLVGGIGLMQIDSVYLSVQSALGKENTLNYIGASGTQGLYFPDLTAMDLETALMAVQSERVRLLDTQLVDQIKAVQARNDQIAKLNNLLSSLNNVRSYLPSDIKEEVIIHTAWLGDQSKNDHLRMLLTSVDDSRVEVGISDLSYKTKGELESAISKVKSLIDSESNSQQMDMLRLQSLNNKKNESIDILTNFMKKMQDSRNSIIGNMR